MSGGRARRFGNLYRLGYEAAAREVYRASRNWACTRTVIVTPGGELIATSATPGSAWSQYSGDPLGMYNSEVEINAIEDDMLAHFRELSQQRVAS